MILDPDTLSPLYTVDKATLSQQATVKPYTGYVDVLHRTPSLLTSHSQLFNVVLLAIKLVVE